MAVMMETRPVAPDRSYEQRIQALERANDIRTYRAELKRDLRAGRRSIIDLLTEPPEKVATMKTFDLLLAVPKLGRTKVNKLLTGCKISPSKTVGGLSERQRREVRAWILRTPRSSRPVAPPAVAKRQRPVVSPEDTRLCAAVRAACLAGWQGWAPSWSVADHFGASVQRTAMRLVGAERRGLVEKWVTKDGAMWRLPS